MQNLSSLLPFVFWLYALFVFKTRHFGCSSLWRKSKGLGCLMWGMNPSLSRKKLFACEVSPDGGSPHWGWCFFGRPHLCLSDISCCGPFIICCGGGVHLVQVFFRGNCSICSCRFGVSMGGGPFRIFLCHCLEKELKFLLFQPPTLLYFCYGSPN